jgi:iron(III) transport system ATP-binding protein
VALARAIITEPRVLLFDEPLSNLDAKLREQMRVEVRKLQKRLGITSVYVTHDQAEAMALSDRIVIMDAGRVQQVGPPLEIYARPASRFVADFIGRVNFLEGRVASVAGETMSVAVRGRRLELPRQAVAAGDAVTLVLRPETIRLAPAGAASDGFPGVVRRALYLGATAEYEVDCDGTTLLAVSGNPLDQGLLSEGTSVQVRFSPKTVHVLAGR